MIRALFAYVILIMLIVSCVLGTAIGYQKYNLWAASLRGEAELKEADWNRQIVVREAEAKKDASSLLAQAEVERAKGVAQSNKIIGNSLKKNEQYLRYLWIDSLQHTRDKIIYIPTEAGLPVLEAGKR